MVTYLEYRGARLPYIARWQGCNLQAAYTQNQTGGSAAPPPVVMQMGLFSEGMSLNPWDQVCSDLQLNLQNTLHRQNEAFQTLMHRMQIASEVLACRLLGREHGCSYAEMSMQSVFIVQQWVQAAPACPQKNK